MAYIIIVPPHNIPVQMYVNTIDVTVFLNIVEKNIETAPNAPHMRSI